MERFSCLIGEVWHARGPQFFVLEIEAARGPCPVIRLRPFLLSSPSRACLPFFHPETLPKSEEFFVMMSIDGFFIRLMNEQRREGHARR